MKNIVALVLMVLSLSALYARDMETKYVAVEKVHLKTGTGFFSRKVIEVYYGTEVIVVEVDDNWSHVAIANSPTTFGWIPNTSLTSKKIVIRNDRSVTTSADELALAGKGFNQEIEDFYEGENSIDFTVIDDIENTIVTEEDLIEFILEGDLQAGGSE